MEKETDVGRSRSWSRSWSRSRFFQTGVGVGVGALKYGRLRSPDRSYAVLLVSDFMEIQGVSDNTDTFVFGI